MLPHQLISLDIWDFSLAYHAYVIAAEERPKEMAKAAAEAKKKASKGG